MKKPERAVRALWGMGLLLLALRGAELSIDFMDAQPWRGLGMVRGLYLLALVVSTLASGYYGLGCLIRSVITGGRTWNRAVAPSLETEPLRAAPPPEVAGGHIPEPGQPVPTATTLPRSTTKSPPVQPSPMTASPATLRGPPRKTVVAAPSPVPPIRRLPELAIPFEPAVSPERVLPPSKKSVAADVETTRSDAPAKPNPDAPPAPVVTRGLFQGPQRKPPGQA